MNRFLVVLLLLVIGVVGLGFYLGWFHFSSDSTDKNTNIQLSVDKEKIKQDQEKATEKIRQAGQKIKDKAKSGSKKSDGEDSRP